MTPSHSREKGRRKGLSGRARSLHVCVYRGSSRQSLRARLKRKEKEEKKKPGDVHIAFTEIDIILGKRGRVIPDFLNGFGSLYVCIVLYT